MSDDALREAEERIRAQREDPFGSQPDQPDQPDQAEEAWSAAVERKQRQWEALFRYVARHGGP